MKRIISLLITAALVLSLCPVFADYSVNSVIADVDFNGNPSFAEGNSFGNLTVEYIDDAEAENNMFVVNAGGAFAVKSAQAVSGKLAVEFKFKQTSIENAGLFAMSDDELFDYGPTLALENGNIVAEIKESVSTKSLTSYRVNTWYYVKLDVNLAANTYDVYVNNVLYGEDIAFNYAMDAITVPLFFDNGAGDGAVVYDDVKLYVEDDGVFTYVYEDFDSYSEDYTYVNNIAGQLIAGCDLLNDNANRPQGGKIDAKNGYVVFGNDSLKTLFLNRQPQGKEITTPITIEFDFCQTVIGTNNLDTVYKCTDWNASKYGVWIASKGGNLYAKNGGNVEHLLLSGIKENQEYHIKIYADPTNQTQTIYIDGKCVGNLKLDDGLTSFGRLFNTEVNPGTSRYYLDNYKLYTDTKEASLNEVGAEISKFGGVIATDTITLPKATSQGHTVAWASSMPDVINPTTGAVTRSTKADYNVILTATVANGGKTTSAKYNVKVERIAQPGVTIIDSDDFSASSVASGATVGKSLSVASSNGASISNEMAMFNKANSTKGFANLYLQYDPEPSKYAIDFTFMADTVGDINTVFAAGGMISDNNVRQAVWIESRGNTLYAHNKAMANTAHKLVPILNGWKANTPYDFTIYIDETTKTYDVYINGICCAADLDFSAEHPTVAETANTIFRPFMTNTGSYAGTYYFDNVVLYTDEAMNELADANVVSPVSASSVVLPVETANGYTITWTTDNENVTVTDGVIDAPMGNTKTLFTATINYDGRIVEKKMYAVVSGGTEPGVTMLDADNFSTTTSVAKSATVGSNFSVVSSNGASVANEMIKLDKKASGNGVANLFMDYNPEAKIYAVSFKFMADTLGDIDVIYSASAQITNFVNAVEIDADSNNIYALSGAKASGDQKRIAVLSGWKAGEWYDFTVYINETTQTYDVYINDICRASGLKFCPEAGTVAPNDVTRLFMTRGGNYAGLYYFDDIMVYTDTGMDELADVTIAERISSKDTVLKTTTKNGYDIDWTTDIEAITVENGIIDCTYENRRVVFTATIDMNGRTVTKSIYALVYGKIGAVVEYDDDTQTIIAKAYKPGDLREYEKPVVILAIYKGNKLITSTLGELTEDNNFYAAAIDVNSFEAGEYTAKAFVMENSNSFAPLSKQTDKQITIE